MNYDKEHADLTLDEIEDEQALVLRELTRLCVRLGAAVHPETIAYVFFRNGIGESVRLGATLEKIRNNAAELCEEAEGAKEHGVLHPFVEAVGARSPSAGLLTHYEATPCASDGATVPAEMGTCVQCGKEFERLSPGHICCDHTCALRHNGFAGLERAND